MRWIIPLILLTLTGCAGQLKPLLDDDAGASNRQARVAAIREVLTLAGERASKALSEPGAFNDDAQRRLTLPANLEPLITALRELGYGDRVDQLENKLNRAAEQAAGEAAPLLRDAAAELDMADARAIIDGGDHAATELLRARTETGLREKMRPVITEQLGDSGFARQYRGMLDVYDALPDTDKPAVDMESHALDGTLEALFTRLAKEEAEIRAAPLSRGSALIESALDEGAGRD